MSHLVPAKKEKDSSVREECFCKAFTGLTKGFAYR